MRECRPRGGLDGCYLCAVRADKRTARERGISLETTQSSSSRAHLLAVHYSVLGTGDWWDNNGGTIFRMPVLRVTRVASVRQHRVPGPKWRRSYRAAKTAARGGE